MTQRSIIPKRKQLQWALTAISILVLQEPHGIEGFRSTSPHDAVNQNRFLSNTNDRITNIMNKYPTSVTSPSSSNAEEASASRATATARSRTKTAATSVATTTSTTALSASTSSLLFNTDTWVFIAGIFPFMWATYEFWRRIMFGESFGTGTDSVIIGMEDSPKDSRGIRVLGRGAIITAYVLFVCAFGTLAVVGYSIATSEAPSDEALAAATAAAASAAASGGDLASLQ